MIRKHMSFAWSSKVLGPEPDPAPKPEVKFTQADLDKIIQERLASVTTKANKDKEELLARLASAAKTAEEKAELEKNLEDFRSQTMTKEQQQTAALEKAKKDREAELKSANERAERFQKVYQTEKMQRDLADAALANKAKRVPQIVDLLSGKARVTDKLGADGKPTGAFETRVKLSVTKDGVQQELDLTPIEAVKAMKDDDENYGNLFDSPATGGLGGSPPKSGGKKAIADLPMGEFAKRYRADKTRK